MQSQVKTSIDSRPNKMRPGIEAMGYGLPASHVQQCLLTILL